MNDLWNLVPADPEFNQHTKRDRIPSLERLHIAEPHLAQTYALYTSTPLLRKALISDTEQRFRSLLPLKGFHLFWEGLPNGAKRRNGACQDLDCAQHRPDCTGMRCRRLC